MNEEAPLRPYQIPAKAQLVRLKRAPLVAPMGSGKTRTALEAYAELKSPDEWCAGICCSVSAQLAWYNQIQQWLGVPKESIGVADGGPEQRRATWRGLGTKYKFVITTFTSFRSDKDKWVPKDLDLFLDEPHRVMRNRSKTWEALCSHTLHSDIVVPVDGTPMRHGPQDMFTYLHLCYPRLKAFGSYWRFVKTWCTVVDGYFGKEIVGPKNLQNFKQEVLGRYCAFIPRSEVDPYLPEKNRILNPIRPTKEQDKIINRIRQDMLVDQSNGKLLITPNVISQILRERQVLCCPKILNRDWGYGACIEAIIERLEDLDVERPVIFTPFADALPYLADRLTKAFPNRRIWTLRGGIKLNELSAIVKGFNESSNDIMVCTVQFAESFEFPRSQWALFCGFDWSWDVNEQAEDRLRRLTSESRVSNYDYFVYEGTVDGDVLKILNDKHRNVRKVTPQNLHEIVGGINEVRL